MTKTTIHPYFDTIAGYFAFGREILDCIYPDSSECRAILRILCSEVLHISSSDILMLEGTSSIAPEHITRLTLAIERLSQGEPLQYILGHTYFYGERIAVGPGALIPRPETEELIELIDLHYRPREGHDIQVLDIGTGSGCIPCALSRCWRERLNLVAWEISPEAMHIAEQNLHAYATKYGAKLKLIQRDLFARHRHENDIRYDLIVSNPPYIHPNEAQDMEPTVLDHEPSLALFAPESNPIIYYEAIAELVPLGYLRPGGAIMVELNPLYAHATLERMCQIIGNHIRSAEIYKDLSNKDRFIRIELL